MKKILEKLYQHQTLSYQEAYECMTDIGTKKSDLFQVAAVISAFNMRIVTLCELEGFRDALLELCIPVQLENDNLMDICGTGGDGKNTFNISTLSAFVIAGAGIPVAKHGNHGVSSMAGSSTVLEFLGLKFTNDNSLLNRQIEESGICFLHAPLFHPALKNVAEVRKGIALKTFFNMLGPIVNPAQPRFQVSGTYNLEIARIYAFLFQKSGKQFTVVHTMDGYDEVSLTSEVKIFHSGGEQLLRPGNFEVNQLIPAEISAGNTIESAAKIFLNVLNGEAGYAHHKVVCANSAIGIRCRYPEISLENAMSLADESLRSGKAKLSFNKLLSLS